MATEILNVTSEESYKQSISSAARALREGSLVVIPTETVYGLAASADHPEAFQKLRDIKGRLDGGPFTVHLGGRQDAAQFLNDMTPFQKRLIERSWPGPLTLIFDVERPEDTRVVDGRDVSIVDRVFHGNSVGLRCPDCPATLDLLSEAGVVTVASSANRKGEPPPTTADQAAAALGGVADLIVDAGPTKYSGASTIARVQGHAVEILREGVLDERAVRRLASTRVLVVCTGNTCRSPMAEGLLTRLLSEVLGCSQQELLNHGFEVRSAGTFAASGAKPTPEAVHAMQDMGIDISQHRSTPLSPEMIEDAQVVLAMTGSHLSMAQSMAPQFASRCRLLAGEQDISDPIGGSVQVYEACRDQIQAALKRQLSECIL